MKKRCYHIWCAIALASLLGPGCASRGAGTASASYEPRRAPERSIESAAMHYNQRCVYGDRESNNCAHFLSDAFIRAGYTELSTRDAITERCQGEYGRVTRAQEMLAWFQEMATEFHQGRPEPGTGFWAGYQEKPGERHVLILDADTGRHYGTADCKLWPVQWFYQW